MQLRDFTLRSLAGCAICLATLPASAATILGTLSRDGRPVAQLELSLSCPGVPPAVTQSDVRGSYQLSINASGKCELLVGAAKATVILFNQAPTQYDFELQGSGAGAQLKRR